MNCVTYVPTLKFKMRPRDIEFWNTFYIEPSQKYFIGFPAFDDLVVHFSKSNF